MRASVLTDVARMEVREVERPAVGPRDVVVRPRAVGLCGTDFHIYAGQANYHADERGAPIPFHVAPQILGHEIAGEVEETGRGVSDLRPGDRVVLDQGLNCRSAARASLCEYCQSGDSHQCEFYRELGITGLPGGLAEYVVIPAVNGIRVEADLEDRVAALTEPLGCVVHSFDLLARVAQRYVLRGEDEARSVRGVLLCGAG
ncbi:MAG TPA: alcohol dehydrogenase catalytic domain-containing protein, partial [Pyrinomonadaceae bacterium]|nr:alcohol dehydrogenase catalytic domain-containing protein [Pyrinomonadaceae bacterium]